MIVFFTICLLLSAALLLLATAMERGAIRGRINGANGLVFLAALIVSILGSVLVVLIAGWVWGWRVALAAGLGSALWHLGMAALIMWSLQRLINRVMRADLSKRSQP